MRSFSLALLAAASLAGSGWIDTAGAQDGWSAQTSVPATAGDGLDFGPITNPDSVDSALEQAKTDRLDTDRPDPLGPLHDRWLKWTSHMNETVGLDLGLNYTVLFQGADAALPGKRRSAMAGDFEFNGSLDLINRDAPWTGGIDFSLQYRHQFGSETPADLGGNIGSLWGTTGQFNPQGFSLNELYWSQGSYDDGLAYAVGKFDPSLFF